ncbi:hypothetical protein [Bilophila wadsworthia]|uniref:hypothetical protein n=1 Tax=Bilophila wadsworthia TaxID=35833 RepID=UPI002431EE33|nr:hypothetical protein [Bilophila wadsworthia]
MCIWHGTKEKKAQRNLSALAEARGISLPDLVERVLAKADAFAVASGSIIG